MTTLHRTGLFSVEAALDAYVLSREEPRVFDGLWHASSISGCQRKAIYEMRQVEPTNPSTPKQRRVFFIGHRIHETMQAAVAASPLVAEVYSEVKVLIPELNTGGAGDQVVVFPDGSAELGEYKSIKEWGFKALKGPKDDHLEQIVPYMFGLREFGGRYCADPEKHGASCPGCAILPPLGPRLSRVRFTYIEKATFDTREFVVDWDPAWEPALRTKVAGLDGYIADPASLPPRLPYVRGKRDYRCDWGWGRCAFFDRCWTDDPDFVEPDPDGY